MAKSGGGSDYDFIFKLVLIGDCGVGKTNLLLRFARDEFHIGSQSTIGVEFAYRQLIVDGKKIKTQIWDTAGQDRFKTVVPQLYRGSEGIVAVFDLTDPTTFANITKWIEEVHRHTPSDLPIILIGNKSDLGNRRKVSREQAIALARQLNISYMETSALNKSNVEEAFTTLVTNIYKKLKSVENSPRITPIDQGPIRTIPILSDPTVEIFSNTQSFRLKKNEELTVPQKSGCCQTS